MKICKACKGSGRCPVCSGRGLVTRGFFSQKERNCAGCDGMGRCPKCKGSGNAPVYSAKIVRIRCPKCGFLKDIFTKQRPVQIECICGTSLILRK
jgi:hypothetical protein